MRRGVFLVACVAAGDTVVACYADLDGFSNGAVPVEGGVHDADSGGSRDAGRDSTASVRADAASDAASDADQLLSQGRPTAASSTQSSSTPGRFSAANAVDGDPNTRWSSDYTDPQWLQVDLGATYTISQVILVWEAAYARTFSLETSNDGARWTAIYSTTTGPGDVEKLSVSGSGRYVRLYGTQRSTAYGYSLFELQVFGR